MSRSLLPRLLRVGLTVKVRAAPADATFRARLADAVDFTIAAAVARGFRLGFEHAVAGGAEAAGELRGRDLLPLVMYFGNETDRREMIDAVQTAKPGMVETIIPERKR